MVRYDQNERSCMQCNTNRVKSSYVSYISYVASTTSLRASGIDPHPGQVLAVNLIVAHTNRTCASRTARDGLLLVGGMNGAINASG